MILHGILAIALGAGSIGPIRTMTRTPAVIKSGRNSVMPNEFWIATDVCGMLTSLPATKGSVNPAIVRTTTATFLCNGRLITADPNTFRVGQTEDSSESGVLVEPTSTNGVEYSSAIYNGGTGWSKGTNVTVTADQAPLFGDANTMELLSATAAASTSVFQTGTQAVSSTGVASVWFRAAGATLATRAGIVWTGVGSGTMTACSCARSDGGTCYACIQSNQYCNVWADDLPTTPVRLEARGTGNASSWSFGINPGDIDNLVTCATHSAGHSILAGNAQLEAQTRATSWIPTTSAAVQRNADLVTLANPLSNTGDWCIASHGLRDKPRSWQPSVRAFLWSMGTFGAANSASMYLEATTGTVTLDIYDGSSTVRRATMTQAFTAGSSHYVTGCWISGQPKIAFDFIEQAATLSGAGTGLASMPATIYLGSADASGSTPFNGRLEWRGANSDKIGTLQP